MNCIKMEQFLSLPEEVQKVFIDWWEIKEGDFAYDVIDEKVIMITRINDENGSKDYWYYDAEWDDILLTGKSYEDGYLLIPLFRLDQLWEFIHTRYKHIGVNNYYPMYAVNETTKVTSLTIGDYEWNIKLFKSMKQFEPDIEIIEKDKLQAFWQVAILVAKEIAEDE